ncbi:MAG TPA: phosphatase PAP2 family protein [Planctomycetota bacterium]|nr:phosphatase PAP2 family protein [Planctomycetota bacterium]
MPGRPSDVVSAGYALLLAGLCVLFSARIPGWPFYALGHLAVPALTWALARCSRPAARRIRDFDLLYAIPAFFFMACALVHRVHPVDYDALLISIDRAIGGTPVLRGMSTIETPLLTALAKWAWISYYVVALLPGVALYRKGDPAAFEEARLAYVLAWCASYLGYFLVPAEGPGYHPQAVGVPQPAWTGHSAALKDLIYALEGEARDTFPSGHAAIATLTVFLCARHRLAAAARVAVPLSAAILASTLYLRYHYLVDVLAGAALGIAAGAAAAVWIARRGAGPAGGLVSYYERDRGEVEGA